METLKMISSSIRFFRNRAHLTQRELSEAIDVHELTIRRWENEKKSFQPRASDIKKLCEVLCVSEAELLNGPEESAFKVTLKFVKTLEGVSEEMNTNGITLTIADDGFVGVSGGKKFESEEDIERVVSEVRRKLTFGLEHRDEIKGEA
jgi:transcriptional regulator with XRE-family HTH domain